ncbi:hypothetical protein Bca4012_022126 [Brassica carinata]
MLSNFPLSLNNTSSSETEPSIKLPLPTFGLASYKLKVSVWEVGTKTELKSSKRSLLCNKGADKWLERRQVFQLEYSFFTCNSPPMR